MRPMAVVASLLLATTAGAAGFRNTASLGPSGFRPPSSGDGVVFRANFATTGCIAAPVADTGQAITVTRASTRTCLNGTVTCQNNELCVEADGALVEPLRTNYFLNSATPANQNVTLSAGAHCAWTTGGSLTVTAGTGTATGLPCSSTAACQCPFTVTAGGTFAVAVADSPTHAQVENGAYATSKITTAGTSVARAADKVTAPSPLNGSPWCVALTATPAAGTWTYSGSEGLWSIGTFGVANSADLYTNPGGANGKLNFDVWDGAAANKNFQTSNATGTGQKTIVACNNYGTHSVYIDGSSAAGAAAGAGTGMIATFPATLRIGSMSDSFYFGGSIKNFKVCRRFPGGCL